MEPSNPKGFDDLRRNRKTNAWPGCPAPSEIYRHQLRMLENKVEELDLQLRQIGKHLQAAGNER